MPLRALLCKPHRLLVDAGLPAGETDLLNIHRDALLDLAEVLRLARHAGEASEVADHAARLYRKKGNVVSAEGLVQPVAP